MSKHTPPSCLIRPTTTRALIGILLAAATLPAAAQSARQLWADNCTRCHGDDGGGAGARSLLDDQWETDGSLKAMFQVTKDGMPDFGMPGYGETLSDPQIWSLINHLHELRNKHNSRQPGWNPRQEPNNTYHTDKLTYRVETVITQDINTPWSVTFLPDGRMIIADRPGELRIYDDGELSGPIADTPRVIHQGQGGMLDVQPHPDYAKNGWFYLSYSHGLDQGGGRAPAMTRIVRGRITDDHRWTDQQTIWEAKPEHYLTTRQHFGCRLVFDDEGHLYFTIGDRGRAEMAQDLTRPNGKVHRIRDDGAIPQDNPFVDRDDAYASIYTLGNRNPQGMTLHPQTGTLWQTEHGPRGGDELNHVKPGRNYGWPEVSHGIHYNQSDFVVPWPEDDQDIEMPTHVWLPSIAVCGLETVVGEPFKPWEGDLLAGGLAGNVVERLRIDEGKVIERERVVAGLGRVRDVVLGPDGLVYLALNNPDHIVRLIPVNE